MDISTAARRNYARTIAKAAGLNLVEEDVDQPRTDGTTIYVPRYDVKWKYKSKEYYRWWYRFLHEVRHNVHKGDFKIIKKHKVNMRSEFGFLYNLILDHNIEVDALGEFDGVDDILTYGRALFLNDSEEKRGDMESHSTKLDAVWFFDQIVRTHWNKRIELDDVLDRIPDVCDTFIDTLKEFGEEWLAEKNPKEAYEFALKVSEALELNQESPEDLESGGGDAEEGEGKPSDEDGEKASGKVIIDYMDMLEHEHSEDGKKGEVEIDYSSWNRFEGWKPGEFEFRDPNEGSSVDRNTKHYINQIHAGEGMANQIRRYLQVMTRKHDVTGRKRGKLDGSRLWKNKAYGAYSNAGRSVHKEREQKFSLDTSVLILVDQSGSMTGEKYYHAAKAAILLTDVMQKIGVPVEVQSFTDTYETCINFVHKSFNKKSDSSTLTDSFATSCFTMSGNDDGDSILEASKVLLKERTTRKIMIVLSDGQPATGAGEGDCYGWTKEVVASLEKLPNFDVYGIGIADKSVKHIYSKSQVIHSASDIEPTLLTLIKNEVLS